MPNPRPIPRSPRFPLLLALAVLPLVGCASAPQPRYPEVDETQLRLLRADLRLMGSETTWVARGNGYDLVSRTREEIVMLQPALDEQGRVFRRLFSAEPERVEVRVAGAPTRPGAPPQAPPPLLAEEQGGALDVRSPLRSGPGARGTRPDGYLMSVDSVLRSGERPAGQRVMERWLRALAAKVGGLQGAPARMPEWAMLALPGLVEDANIEDLIAVQLAAHPEALLPVAQVLGSECPKGGEGSTAPAVQPRVRDLAALRNGPPLTGRARCEGQALLIARYLMSREGYGILGRMVSAQLAGAPVTEGLVGARSVATDLTTLDGEWRRWLMGRADQVGPRDRR